MLIELKMAVDALKLELRRQLLRALGVDRMVKKAFQEGWYMHSETDEHLMHKVKSMASPAWAAELDDAVKQTRVWRSLDEAWANSDSEEEV